MNNKRLADFFRSRFFLGILIGIIGMLVVFCIFEAGVAVGFHEAAFSSHWDENYGQNFGPASDAVGLPSSHAPTPDGTVGQIASIAISSGGITTLVISSNLKPEEKVLVDGSTVIRERDMALQPSGLSVGMNVVVLGSPDAQGEIDAKLIRIFTVPLDTSSSTPGSANSPAAL